MCSQVHLLSLHYRKSLVAECAALPTLSLALSSSNERICVRNRPRQRTDRGRRTMQAADERSRHDVQTRRRRLRTNNKRNGDLKGSYSAIRTETLKHFLKVCLILGEVVKQDRLGSLCRYSTYMYRLYLTLKYSALWNFRQNGECS